MTIYQLKDQPVFVKHIAEFTNGIETTGGLYKAEQLTSITEPVSGITYDAKHCMELPVDWFGLFVLDDRDKRIKLIEIDFASDRPYIMEDGYKSTEVTL